LKPEIWNFFIMQKRIFSIDVFRAITMVLMIFVNDFWSLTGIPPWLEHARADQDFLGFSDIIFPCFLFIVGMSIPYAIRNRIDKGENHLRILAHILVRSLALLVMGFFTVNISDLNVAASGLSHVWFQILMVIGFFLIWNVYPKSEDWKKYLFIGLQVIGIALLITLALVFKGGKDGSESMTHQWWGILGLIGWTYLVSASLYLFIRKSTVLLLGAWFLFTLLNIADHANWLKTPIPGGGAFQGFAFAGIAASLLLDWATNPERRQKLPWGYFGIGILLVAAGFILRNFFIISKIQATPTWVFLCNGIAFGFLAVIYYLVDLKKKTNWFNLIKPAGNSTLTCYLIPYVYYSLATYAFTIPVFLKTGAIGLVKSMVYALIIVGITALLGKVKVRMKI
jgi:heparan-alpha-glucosaminide N-acetyltransferase